MVIKISTPFNKLNIRLDHLSTKIERNVTNATNRLRANLGGMNRPYSLLPIYASGHGLIKMNGISIRTINPKTENRFLYEIGKDEIEEGSALDITSPGDKKAHKDPKKIFKARLMSACSMTLFGGTSTYVGFSLLSIFFWGGSFNLTNALIIGAGMFIWGFCENPRKKGPQDYPGPG